MKRFLHDNGLTLTLLALFAFSVIGQVVSGLGVENEDRLRHGQAAIGLMSFLGGGQFLSSLFENWESEFLQMFAFVMLTAYLFQRGSPESRDPDAEEEPQDRDPALDARKRSAPWPVRAGNLGRTLYSHSLGIALLALFIASFLLHWVNSTRLANDEAAEHGEAASSLLEHLASPEFWFESFQNWQSEFLSTAVLIVLAIYLRERHSPESKPVSTPHAAHE